MFELIDTHPDVNVQEAEYIRLLGYPRGHALEGRPLELAYWARQWYMQHGKPWVYARKVEQFEVDRDRVMVEGTIFSSEKLRDQLLEAHADDAFLVAASAGKECEEMARKLWLEEKPDEYFFLETFGSAVVEHLIANTGFRFCEWADRQQCAILPHYSPGYPGWDVSDQQQLMNVIVKGRTNVFPGELQVLQTGMLNPKKSLLAVFGVTPDVAGVRRLTSLIPCSNCSLPSCQYRRVPYRKAMPRIESVRPLAGTENGKDAVDNAAPSPLTPDAQYTIGASALRKWSQERLQISFLDDESVEAEFRFEGTTCSNLGKPLEFLYRVKLRGAADMYRVEDTRCAPSPTDDGYRYMCEYLDKGDSFIRTIADEQPLLGMPLDEVLRWGRQFSPSGCFCNSTSRQHKWGLVFEVIHFALAQRHAGTITSSKQTDHREMRNSQNPIQRTTTHDENM